MADGSRRVRGIDSQREPLVRPDLQRLWTALQLNRQRRGTTDLVQAPSILLHGGIVRQPLADVDEHFCRVLVLRRRNPVMHPDSFTARSDDTGAA